MKVIFRGDPAELERGEGLSRTTLDLWDVHFKMGVVTDVSHLDAAKQAKLHTNGHFEVVQATAEPATEDAAGADAPAAEAAPAPKPGHKKGTVKAKPAEE